MSKKLFDLFVVGAGSGGVRAARIASARGLKVGLAEGWDLGGTCVNRGCVPKKLYSFSSHFSDDFDLMESFGWSTSKIKFSWEKLVKNKKKELLRLNDIYLSLLKNSGVKIYKNYASFLDKNSLIVGKEKVFSKKILIAVGSKPKRLGFSAFKSIKTSDEIFDINELPKKLLILGGGYIAVEFASIFNGLGVNTTINIRSRQILKGFDYGMVGKLMNQMQIKGVKIKSGCFPTEIYKRGKKFAVSYKDGSLDEYDLVLEAVGREPNLDKLGLKNVGIKVNENSSIVVDNYFRTSQKNIYAIGDVIDRIQLTPVAISEAMNLVHNLLNKKKLRFNYKNVPTAVFTNPNFACVGMTEEIARKKIKNIRVFTTEFRPLRFSMSKLKEKVFIKMIINSKNQKILGLHYIGENAAEIIQGFAIAIVNGLKKSDIEKTIGIHPTSAEEIVTLKN